MAIHKAVYGTGEPIQELMLGIHREVLQLTRLLEEIG